MPPKSKDAAKAKLEELETELTVSRLQLDEANEAKHKARDEVDTLKATIEHLYGVIAEHKGTH